MKWSFVGAVSLLAVPASAGIDWNYWFAKLNFTAQYAQPVCMQESVDHRLEYEALVNNFIQAPADQRVGLAQQHELWIACSQLIDGIHAEIVDEYDAGRAHVLGVAEQMLAARLKDVINESNFKAAHHNSMRNIVRMNEKLAEIKEYQVLNTARIAHTPKIFVLCACLVAIGYYAYHKFGDKIEQEIQDVGHQLAHEITST